MSRPHGGVLARGERGSVTAETAVALPSLVLVVAVATAGVAAATAQLRCVDAAQTGARAAARGEAADTVRRAVVSMAPAGAQVTVERQDDEVHVGVAVPLRFPGPVLSRLPAFDVRAEAVAIAEPGSW